MRPVSRARSEAPGSRQGRTLGTSDGNRRNAIELWHAKQRQPLQRAAAPTPRGASSTTSAGREKVGAGQLSQSRRHGASGSCSRFSLGRKIRGSCRSSGDTPPR